MAAPNFENFPWLPPWQPISIPGQEAYESELKAEICQDHPLYGLHVTAIGRTGNGDDVLFRIHGHRCQLAVVHLTFSGRTEKNPRWPTTTFFTDQDDWIMRCMIPDLAKFEQNRKAA
jgi:hypothetical protein